MSRDVVEKRVKTEKMEIMAHFFFLFLGGRICLIDFLEFTFTSKQTNVMYIQSLEEIQYLNIRTKIQSWNKILYFEKETTFFIFKISLRFSCTLEDHKEPPHLLRV